MKKKQVIRRKSNVIPKYEIGGVTYGDDIFKQLLKLKLADEDKSALGYGVDYGMRGMSAGSGFGGIGGTTGSLIMGGVGLVGGLLDGIINGKKDAEAENKMQRKGVIDTMQANMYSGSTSVNNPLGQTVKYPYGGMMQPNAEVEGGEVLKAPNGQVNTMQGPSHAQGGIDVNAPQGTKVYSDRIKHKVGNKSETYADTAAKLNKILDKYKKVDKNEDTLKKNSDALMIARILQKLDNLFEEQEVQKNIQGIEQPEQQTMAGGGLIGDPPDKDYNPYAMNPNYQQYEEIESLNPYGTWTPDKSYNYIMDRPGAKDIMMTNDNYGIDIANYKMPVEYNKPIKTYTGSPALNVSRDEKQFGPDGGYNEYYKPKSLTPQVVDYKQSPITTPDIYNAGLPNNGFTAPNVPQTDSQANGTAETPEELQRKKEEKQSKWKSAGAGILEAAPTIYNLLQKKPDHMPTAPYMDTQTVTPERMSNEQDLREAERNYSAMVNDQSLPAAQRLLAARQLQSTKAQILQRTENQYKQDVNRAQEVNTAKIHKNIDTAMKIKDINDANIGAYANKRAQAMGDIGQLAQKKTLEKNMSKHNEMMMNTLKSAFPDYSFKDDGTVVHKSGKPLTPEQLETLSKYKQNLYYISMMKSGSYMPQYNESYYNQIGNTLDD